MHVDHACILKLLKLETTSSQKTSCRTRECRTASFLATGGFVRLFHEIPWFSMNIQIFFKFHDFFMHGTFLVIFQFFIDFQSVWEPCKLHKQTFKEVTTITKDYTLAQF